MAGGIPYKPLVYTPLKYKPIQHEWSHLRTQRDSHSPLKRWRDHSEVAHQVNHLTNLVMTMGRQMSKMQAPALPQFDFFPFRVYTVPLAFRPTEISGSYDPLNNWRTFRVRQGEVLIKYAANTSGSNSPTYVFGCDGFQYPDSNQIMNGLNDYVVPLSQSRHYFWIETVNTPIPVTGSYILQHGNNPAEVGIVKWTNFPTSSANHLLIAYVDTLSSASINQSLIRQYVRSDITAVANYITMSLCQNGQEVVFFVDAYQSGSA